MKVLVTKHFEENLRELKSKADIMSVYEFVNAMDFVNDVKVLKSKFRLKRTLNNDDIYVYRINKYLRVFLSLSKDKEGREIILLVSVSDREKMSNEILLNYFNDHSIEVSLNRLKKIINLLDQSLYSYTDSCTGAPEVKYYRRDANIPLSLYEELVEVINEIDDEFGDRLSPKVKVIITEITYLLDIRGPIGKLAYFNEERYVGDMMLGHYFDDLEDSIEHATQLSFEKLEELADEAQDSVELLFKLINQVVDILEEE